MTLPINSATTEIYGTVTRTDRWAYQHQANRLEQSAEQLAASFQRAARFYRVLLGDTLSRLPEGVALDLPCGEGQMLYLLRAMSRASVEGVDLDAARVGVARRLGLPARVGDVFAELEAQRDGAVGSVFSLDFLEHLDKADVVRYLELVHRKLRAGGVFFTRTPCADSPFGARHIYNDFTHKWAATSGVLRGLLHGAGFAEARVFGEEPRWAMSGGWWRVPIYRAAAAAASLATHALGIGQVEIWTPSMWGVGEKV